MSAEGPPLASEVAQPVRELEAHTSAGLRRLRALSDDELVALPALAPLLLRLEPLLPWQAAPARSGAGKWVAPLENSGTPHERALIGAIRAGDGPAVREGLLGGVKLTRLYWSAQRGAQSGRSAKRTPSLTCGAR